MDFTLFAEYPEFCAKYMLLNVKNHTIYTDKLQVYVVELGQTKLATEEDRLYGIDYWAKLFKAETWEEIKMLAEKNEFLNDASETIYQLSADEKIREQCWAREEYNRIERTVQRQFELAAAREAELEQKLKDQQEEHKAQEALYKFQIETLLEEKKSLLAQLAQTKQ